MSLKAIFSAGGDSLINTAQIRSVQYGDAAVRNSARRQQWRIEGVCDGVQHGAGVQLVEQQRLTGPVQQHSYTPGPLHHLQGDMFPRVAEGEVTVVMGQHPGLAVVSQPRLVPGPLAHHAGVADPDLEGPALAHVHHPAVGAGGDGQGAQRVGPAVEACRVIGRGLAGLLGEEGESAEVVGEGEQGADGALVELQVGWTGR